MRVTFPSRKQLSRDGVAELVVLARRVITGGLISPEKKFFKFFFFNLSVSLEI